MTRIKMLTLLILRIITFYSNLIKLKCFIQWIVYIGIFIQKKVLEKFWHECSFGNSIHLESEIRWRQTEMNTIKTPTNKNDSYQVAVWTLFIVKISLQIKNV